MRKIAVLPLLATALLLAGCGGKMPKLGFGARDSRPPPLAELAAPPASPNYTFCQSCLLTTDGKQVPPATGIRGFLDGNERQGDKLILFGWAADIDAKAPAAEVIFIGGGQVIGRARPTEARPDVAQALQLMGSPSNLYGYRIIIDAAQAVEPMALFAIDRAGRAQALTAAQR